MEEIPCEQIERASQFALRMWQQRATELGREIPDDLSGACKFCSVFARGLWGGAIVGNSEHVFVRRGMQIIDLTAMAKGTLSLGMAAYNETTEPDHPDYRESISNCIPRVMDWFLRWQEEGL